MKRFGIILFMFFLSATQVFAANYSINFPEFYGKFVYPSGPNPNQVAFDFGVDFSSIQHAELNVVASGTQGIYSNCYFGVCTDVSTYGPSFLYGFSGEGIFGSVHLTENFNTYTIDISSKSDFILDGQGKLYVQPDFLAISLEEGHYLQIVEPSSFTITSVSLNLEATAVPLPPSLLLSALGISCLIPFANRRRMK